MSELKIAVMEGNAQRAGALLMEDSPSATALADACTTIGALRDGLAALQMSEKEGAGAVAARADFERRKAALAASTTELEKLAAAKTAAQKDISREAYIRNLRAQHVDYRRRRRAR